MEHLIGKKIKVRINDRDFSGKIIHNKFTSIIGVCTYAGYNKFIGEWQVTVNRTPIFPIKFKDVEVLD